jgi:cytochrome P450
MNAVFQAALPQPLVSDAFLRDPYPTYEALRAAGPIHWSTEFFGGAWVLTNHADVEAMLRDAQRFSAQRTGGWVMHTAGDRGDVRDDEARRELGLFQRLFARAMLFMDAPDHTRLRTVMMPSFRPAVMAAMQVEVEQMISTLIDGIERDHGHAPFDFMARFARPLPAQVICQLMGIATPDQHSFIEWSDTLAAFIGAPQPTLEQARAAHTALQAMSAYFETILPAKRANPGDDLLSRLAVGEAEGQVHGGAEMLAQCAMLLFAGHETTRNLLGNGLQVLLSQPGAWAQLVAEPALIPGAVRELLRFECPVQYTGRRVTTELTLHGQRLKRGDLVVGLIGAANRDPAQYETAQQFDLRRKAGSSLAFGHGVHLCIGAALTLMEGEAALRALVKRWPKLRLATDAAPDWVPNPVYRGLATLPVSTWP